MFEHATLDGSEKYLSASLLINLMNQTYNTCINASTWNCMTGYPVASLSEAQLLAYTDFYTDSCFHPTLMHDKGAFREKAWRYSLTDPDAELTLAGTVYSEIRGTISQSSIAYNNFARTVCPGSVRSNESGGLPCGIPSLTFQALCDFHGAYYHPSNSLTCLYGSFVDYAPFLKVLDDCFSDYEHREAVVAETAALSNPVEDDASQYVALLQAVAVDSLP